MELSESRASPQSAPGTALIGFATMMVGVVVALTGFVIGAGHTRKRRDLPRAWWLSFRASPVGDGNGERTGAI